MKLTKRNSSLFSLLFFLGLITGTFAWEIIERVLSAAGTNIDLSVGPLGIDLDVIAVYVKVNPGSLFGIAAGLILFFRL